MKKKLLYLPILLLTALFAGCSDDEDSFIEDSPALYSSYIRLDFYNADGTEYDITPRIESVTTLWVTNPDKEKLGLSETGSQIEIKGNSIYTYIGYWSNEYRECWNNIPFTIILNSPKMFNDNENRRISLTLDGDRIVDISRHEFFPDGYILTVESEDLDIYCDRKYVEDDYFGPNGKVLPIRVTLSANGGD
ncbi:unknown [Prevotella sp. CAG:1124]|nr:unknown [Prevotella sp. CAG:1124]